MNAFFAIWVFAPILQPLAWQAEGRTEAERDIAAGAMKWKIYGHMAGLTTGDIAFARLMRERYGVEVEAVAQCVVTDELVHRAEGYNARISDELDAKFGSDAVKRLRDDSAAWREQPPGRHGLRALAVLGGLVVLRRLLGRWRTRRVTDPAGDS